MGWVAFWAAPLVLVALLQRVRSCHHRVRIRSIVVYLVVMSVILGATLHVVAWIAGAVVPPTEVLIVLWFAVLCRLTWTLWRDTVGRWGERYVRLARYRRTTGAAAPLPVRWIPVARFLLTALVFVPMLLAFIATHRCKLRDGMTPGSLLSLKYEHIRIPSTDDLLLDGWFIPDGKSERTIVICHGAGANKGNFAWFLPPLSRRGYNILMFDFRAHGSSDGRVTTWGIREAEDVIAAVAWLKANRPAAAGTIIGLGSSQGAMALALAAERDDRIGAMILDSPFVSHRELVRDKAGYVPIVGPLMADYLLMLMSWLGDADFLNVSAERAIAGMTRRPTMIIHGDEDIAMPREHSQRLYDAAGGPKAIWFGPGMHSNIVTTAPQAYAKRVLRFIELYCRAEARDVRP